MYDFGEDDYDFIKELRKGGDLADKKPKQIKQEEKVMSIVRLEIGQYEFVELDLTQDEGTLQALIDTAKKVQAYKNSGVEEAVEPAPKAGKPAASKPTPKPKAGKPSAGKPTPKPKAGKKGDYPDSDLEDIKFKANQAYDLKPIKNTGDTKGTYGKLYFYVVEIDGVQYKTAIGKTEIVELFDQCIAEYPEAVLTVGKNEDNHWYVLDDEGESLI